MKPNILTLHAHLLSRFDEDQKNNEERLDLVESLLAYNLDEELMDDLLHKKETILQAIKANTKSIYLAKTELLVQEYIVILKRPMSVLAIKNRSPTCVKKDLIISKYLSIAKDVTRGKHWDNITFPSTSGHEIESFCQVCDNFDPKQFETDDNNRKICLNCSAEQYMLDTGITHRDYNRVNVIGKFVYNRVLHFQDCIKQYQGKQNCKVPEKLYGDLETKFRSYRLLVDSPIESAKYSKITKTHIMMFLKELKYTKHYENVNLIYFTLTNKRADDISYLEQQLVEDFRELVSLYDSIHGKDKPDELDRKNFMNVQYLLFQLLRRHGHPCKIEDFSTLKTIDRKLFHDNICSNLFTKLAWNFTPTF